ncbi:hypothetical protein DRQ05_00400 [bacterium]|nr:MAG: hypothetical protein DRQ05_00400 [bacterium]
MVLKLRKVDRRHFKSSINIKRRRARDYYYAAISVFVVKIVLFVFLLILFSVSYRLFSTKFKNITAPVRFAVPMIILLFSIVLLYYIYKNFRDIRDMHKEKDKAR